MNLDAQTPQRTTQTQSSPSFDDSPLVALLQADPSKMSQEERVEFVTRLRQLRQTQAMKVALAREVEEEEDEVRESKKGPSVQQLIDDLLKEP